MKLIERFDLLMARFVVAVLPATWMHKIGHGLFYEDCRNEVVDWHKAEAARLRCHSVFIYRDRVSKVLVRTVVRALGKKRHPLEPAFDYHDLDNRKKLEKVMFDWSHRWHQN